tara:strand:+ start:105 stop:722 length:618 start_codon:yes stop_codon:yes gene_type:complete
MNKEIISLPLFPLNGAILFPESNLPLNIFEERYIDMIDYALSRDKKIGMIQSKEDGDELYRVGCVGKITSYHETDDNRYVINLYGVNYFKIIKEIKTQKKFRIFQIEEKKKVIPNIEIEKNNFDKFLLIEKFKLFISKTSPETNINSIENLEIFELVKILAMACPFTVSEKQMLLESINNNVLAKNLLTLFDFYNNQSGASKNIN